MRRFCVTALVFLASAFSFATVTVSGNLVNPATGSVSSRAFVRFWIRGCGGNAPRITGTGMVLPSYTDLAPTAGAISGTLYDSLTEISCGGSVGATWYGVQAYYDGKPGPEVPYNVTGASFNLNSATPNTTSPVVSAPTGDSTYVRLDGGNNPTGTISPSTNGTLALGSTSARWDLFANDIDSNSFLKLRQSSAPTCLSSIGFIWYDSSNLFKFCNNGGSATAFGSVTSVATTSPITGGTITATGTIACATCVTSSSPGVGIAHFAGSTQAVTSSAVNLANSDVTGNLPVTNLNSGTNASSATYWRGDATWAQNSINTLTVGIIKNSTTFSDVSGMSWSIAASTSYILTCQMSWGASVNTAGPKFQLTGPSSPTAVILNMTSAVTATTSIYASTNAFSSAVANTGTVTTATTLPAIVTAGIVNGSNAGTLALQAAANGAGNMSLVAGDSCVLQQQ